MVDGLGIGLGAAAQQINIQRQQGLQQQQLQIQERAQQFTESQALREQIERDFENVTTSFIERKRASPMSSEEFNQRTGRSIEGVANILNGISQRASQLGIDVGDLTGRFLQTLQNTPTAGEAGEAAGRVTAIEQVSRAEELTQFGIPTSQALAAAGIPQAEIPRFQTEVGKLISDLDIAEQRFGEDSPQARALTEALQSKQQGETQPDFSDVRGLRQEFTKASQDFVSISQAFDRVKFAAENPTAAGDVALIFAFMKMLDPRSVVREGEFATAETAGSVPSQIVALYNRVREGTRLAPEVRRDFFNQSKGIFSSQLQRQVAREREFSRLAESFRFPVEQVIIDFKQGITPDDISFATTRATAEDPSGVSEVEETIGVDDNILSKPITEITTEDVRRLTPQGRQRLREMLQSGQ